MRANQGVLSVGGIGESGEDGLMVELGGAGAYEMDLQPMTLQTNGTVSMSVNGVGDLYYFQDRNFLGPVHLHDTNGVTEVGGTFGSDSTNRVLISMLQDGAMTGRIDTESGAWGSISNGTWKITAFGVRPAEGTNRSAIYVKFDTQVSFVPGGTQTALTGNQMAFSWLNGPDADSFQNFQVQGSGLPGFSITNVVTTPASPEKFSIVRSGPDIQFSWPYRISSTYLRSAQNITDPFTTTNLPSYELKGPRWQFTIAAGGAPQEFFQLWDWCLDYNRYLDNE